jgi:NADPH:quinone reductase-like Zn-dependent oxidoreductase
VAGVVEDAGGSALAPGTRVATMLHAVRQGAYAEYVAAVTADAARIPEGLSFDIAAGVPTPGLTGVQMIEEHLDVQRGQTVLITGAVGMVGRFAMHAARRRGARIVAAVRAHQRDAARDMGADTSVVLDAEAWTGGTIDHVADTVGGASVAALCRHVPAGGKIYTAATTPIPPEHLATSPMFFAVHPDAARLADLLGAVAAGDIDLRIKAMKLAEAAEAQEMAISGGQAGKLVLRP